MNKKDYALKYARLGIRVFPIHPNTKEPAINNWPVLASTDPNLIERWWAIEPDYNIGVATGQGVVAIDADTKDGKPGLDSLQMLDLEVIPTSLRSRTPSGGVHVLLKTNRAIHNRVNSIAEYPGIDIRGENGYILAAGSTLPNGAYELTANGKIEDMPQEFADILAKRPQHQKHTEQPVVELDTPENVDKAIRWLEEIASPAIEGEGGDEHTYKTATRLRDFGLSEPIALDLMLGHWNERNEPPWAPEDLSTKVANAFNYASGTWGGKTSGADFDAVEIDVGEKPESVEVAPEIAKASDDRKRRSRFHVFTSHEIRHTATSVVFKPLVDGVINQGTFALVYGKPGAAKTFNMIDMGVCIATGKPWAGQYDTSKGAVFYIAGEGGTGIHQRVTAALDHHDAPPDAPFFLLPSAVDFTSSNEDAKHVAKLANRAAERSGHPLKLIVIDTVNRSMGGGDENSAVDMGKFIANVDLVRAATNATVVAIHHTGKDEAKGARGHSSLLGALDTEILVKSNGQIETTKQRDLPELETVATFVLLDRGIGDDPEGRPLKSAIVSYRERSDFDEGMPLTAGEERMLAALRAAVENVRATGQVGGGVTWDQWFSAYGSLVLGRGEEAGEGIGTRQARRLADGVINAGYAQKRQRGLFALSGAK